MKASARGGALSGQCRCGRCRRLPEPIVIGDQHEVAVVLFLDLDAAYNVAAMHPATDSGASELHNAAAFWEALRDA